MGVDLEKAPSTSNLVPTASTSQNDSRVIPTPHERLVTEKKSTSQGKHQKSKGKYKLIIMGIVVTLLLLGLIIASSLVKKGKSSKSKWCSGKEDLSVTVSNKGRAKCGQLIFDEEFNNFDLDIWEHELTMAGGGNWEFQMYQNNRSNSYVKFSNLYIKPTLTSATYGEETLYREKIEIGGSGPADQCTNSAFFGCSRQGSTTNPINPIMSARIRTVNSFSFKYGIVEVRAQLPVGDWLWPAIWLMPQKNEYGGWPSSGEIDIMESRGNLELFDQGNNNIGVERISSTLHFGPYPGQNGWSQAHFVKNRREYDGYHKDFHTFRVEWTPESIKFSVDGETTGIVKPQENFWELGKFSKNIDNPWKFAENVEMAPFDKKFYIVINLAVGGTGGFFPDNAWSKPAKPWKNNSTTAILDFMRAKDDWYPTWRDEDSALKIDYIRVWAL